MTDATGVRKFIGSTGVPRVLKCLSIILLTGFFFWNIPIFVGVNAQKAGRPVPTVTPIPIKFHEDHRSIQWCVNGFDEPEFHRYPWSEFKPIIQRKYYSNFKANLRYTYTVSLWPIKTDINTEFAPGSGGNLLQRAHFVLSVKLRREFETGVNLEYRNDTEIEGLLVQANFAPYGVGLPMGQFVHPKEFNCVDCKKPLGIPIACRKRTHMHIVHPTIMAYHHKMKIPEEEKDRRRNHCYNKFIQSQCIITGFDVNDEFNQTGSVVPPDPAAPPPPAGVPPPQPPFEIEWMTTLNQYLNQPHPGFTSACEETAECQEKLKEWFKSDCCAVSDGGICNNTIIPAPPGAPPTPDPVGQFCPNKPTPAANDVYEEITEFSKDKIIFECRPFTISVCRPPNYPRLPRWEELYGEMQYDWRKITPEAIPPLANGNPGFDPFDPNQARQCCLGVAPAAPGTPCPPPPPGAPPRPSGQERCPPGDPATGFAQTECITRVVPIVDRNQDPWTEIFPQKNEAQDCSFILQNEIEYGTSNEVHGNFVWYLPPCRGSKVKARFRFLAVHSFYRGIYSIQESDFYELKSGALSSSIPLNPHIPTPLFKGVAHKCETPVTSVEFLYSTIPALDNDNFDFSRSYDDCVQTVTGVKKINDQTCEGIPHFVPYTKKKPGGRPQPPVKYPVPIPKCDKSLSIEPLYNCEADCPTLPATTPEYVSTPSNRVIKRTLHGGINIVTNFCIMPICVYIARYYKETFNLQSFKGQKTWYWMHMIGAGGSTVFMYMGYFTEKLVDEFDAHLAYGGLYVICLGISYMTAWIRHKNQWISMIMEGTHSGCGYACFVLALICVTNAKQNGEPISDAVKYVVYVAIASVAVFHIGTTIHICAHDRRFGMKPARWHFPSVEARFDDLPTPGRKIRMMLMYCVLIINLPLTLSTLFL